MDMIANVVRGGQLCLHKLRMLNQVLYSLIIWSLLVGGIAFGTKSYFSITKEEVKGFIYSSVGDLMYNAGFGTKEVVVEMDSQKYSLPSSSISSYSYFIDMTKAFKQKLSIAFVLGYAVVIGSFVMFVLFFITKGLGKSGEKFMRGASIGDFRAVKKTILKANQDHTLESSYEFGGMPFPTYGETEHTLIIGSTGTGKTVLISDLVDQIRARGDKAVIYDKKGDYIKWFYDPDKDIILNPFDERGAKWNLLSEIDHIGHLKTLAHSFIPDRGGYAGESKVWDEAARIAFSGILEKLLSNHADLTNKQIVDLILCQDIKAVANLVKSTYAQSTIDANSPKTAASVMFVLATHFSALRLTSGTRAESFSIKKWIRGEKKDSILFISSVADLSAELNPLITAWFEIVINGVLSGEQNLQTKTWIILDELPSIQKIPSLPQGLSLARVYGGCFVLGCQNIAQMREIYGRSLTEDISSECNTRGFFKTNDPDTANWICRNIGDSEIIEYKEGLSYGAHAMRDGTNVSSQERMKSLILPSEIQSMSKLNLLLKMPGYPCTKAKLAFKDRSILNKSYIPDTESLLCIKSNAIADLESDITVSSLGQEKIFDSVNYLLGANFEMESNINSVTSTQNFIKDKEEQGYSVEELLKLVKDSKAKTSLKKSHQNVFE